MSNILNKNVGVSTPFQSVNVGGGGGGGVQMTDEMRIVEERLLTILENLYPQGVLGAHIPTIYKDFYGEPIQLQGRKLKDILLGMYLELYGNYNYQYIIMNIGTGMAEILGGDNSPGGKRFRFLSQNPRREDMELDAMATLSSPNKVFYYYYYFHIIS